MKQRGQKSSTFWNSNIPLWFWDYRNSTPSLWYICAHMRLVSFPTPQLKVCSLQLYNKVANRDYSGPGVKQPCGVWERDYYCASLVPRPPPFFVLRFQYNTLASFPGSPEREMYTYAWRAWYIFSRDQNRTRVLRTERQRFARYSTNFLFNAQCVWYSLPNS